MAIYRRSEDISIINEVRTGTIDMKKKSVFSCSVNIDEPQAEQDIQDHQQIISLYSECFC